MTQISQPQQMCQICKKKMPQSELIPASAISSPITKIIVGENITWSEDGYICFTDLNHYRTEHIKEILTRERGEMTDLEADVTRSLTEQELMSQNLNEEFSSQLTIGAKIADKVASFGGSWKFIIIFGAIILVWIILNAIVLTTKPFDPYPFILLNLMLSCLAAMQAPIIMMSQNRQEAKDRLRSEHDYKVNLKAELEIRHLNDRLDHLINQQWQNLLETQQIQLQMLEELMSRRDEMKGDS